MADKLQLQLLGPFQVGDKPGIPLRRKNRAILAYLALSPIPLGRHELANLFCQSAADPAHTFRLSLSRLRRALGQAALVSEGQTIQFNQGYFQTDIAAFQQILGEADLPHVTVEQLEKGVMLYRGDFLEGVHLPDAPEFEMWLVGQRSYWRQLYERGALALLKGLVGQERYPAAFPIAQRLVQQNPLLEEAHYHLIWLYAQMGRRTAALQQFAQCRIILQQELAVQPTPELLILHDEIQAGRPAAVRSKSPLKPAVPSPVVPAADFVGRETEFEILEKAWADVRQGGTPRTLLITAEAGGGKTRLVQEWARRLPEGTFFYGPCYESTTTLPYHPWLAPLEQLYSRLDSAEVEQLPSPWLDALARLLPGLAGWRFPSGSGQQHQLLTAVHALFKLANRPLLLFLDDWQWADAASLQLAHFLMERPAPFLLIGAYRTEEADNNPALLTLLQDWSRREDISTLALAPLSPQAVTQLMNRLWPQLPKGYREPHLRDRLIQATRGNPLFLNEIVRELAGTTQLPETLPVPPSLRELIQRRLGELPSSGRQVLESLAILNQPAQFDLARQISGRSEDETLDALELGLRRRLLLSTRDTPPLVAFSHDLMGQAVREQLSPIRRQVLHRRTARKLAETGAKAATLAYHWGEAGDTDKEAACALTAGEEAFALYANEEAIYFFERVLAIRPTAAAWLKLGDVQRRIGRWDQTEAAFQQALSLARTLPSTGEEAAVLLALGKLEVGRGDYEAGKGYLQTAEQTFHTHNQRQELADTYNNLAIIAYYQSHYQTALDYYEAAVQIDETLANKEGLIKRLGNMGLVHLQQGQLDEAQKLLEQSLQLARDIKNQEFIANRLNSLGVVASKRGSYDEALALYQQAIAIDETLGNTQALSRSLGNMGIEYYQKGDYQQALTHWHRALVMEKAMGNTRAEARLLGNIGEAWHDFGDFDQAQQYLALALQMDLPANHRDAVARHISSLARIYRRQAQWAEAARWVEAALTLSRQIGANIYLAENLFTAAELAFQKEDWQTAETLLLECLPLAHNKSGRPIHLPVTILLLQTHIHQQKTTTTAAIQQLESLLPTYPDPAHQAALQDAIWQLNPARQDARQKAAEQYQTAHQKFPHILFRQRHTALTGAALTPPNITMETPVVEPAETPPPHNLDQLYTQLMALLSK